MEDPARIQEACHVLVLDSALQHMESLFLPVAGETLLCTDRTLSSGGPDPSFSQWDNSRMASEAQARG